MEVALLGGSFNPPHIGHLMAATFVRATLGSDKVWLMPAFHHPFGKTLEAFEHRVRMCEEMARDAGTWLEVNPVEQELGGEGRTVDTLTALVARHPEARFTLVIGSDIVKDLPHWKEFERIEQLARILVLHRAGHPAEGAVGPPMAEVSSTEVRTMLEQGRLPRWLVPAPVLAYAQREKLYGLK